MRAAPRVRARGWPARVLVVDVGGSHVKILATGHSAKRRMKSGPKMTPEKMVAGVLELAHGWKFDAVAMGYPGSVAHNRPQAEPHNLGGGWVEFDYEAAFGCPVKMVNDAALQALGSYEGGKMLFLGFGTGLGTTLIVDDVIVAMELAHLPYMGATFEHHVGAQAKTRDGKKKWRHTAADVIARLTAATQPEDVVLGGGNASNLKEIPEGARLGNNDDAFAGGFRLWKQPSTEKPARRKSRGGRKSAGRS